MHKPRKITPSVFKKFGVIIEYPRKPPSPGNLFRIVVRERKPSGWRIAYLVVRDRKISRLEQHLDTLESFEPVKGRSLIYLAPQNNPEKIECFYLDRPVVLDKGVWHGVVSLGGESEIKISENAFVRSRYRDLGFSLGEP